MHANPTNLLDMTVNSLSGQAGTSPINNATSPPVPPVGTPQSLDVRVSRMKMCSRCCRAKYCSKLCQVYDWRSGRHKLECQFL